VCDFFFLINNWFRVQKLSINTDDFRMVFINTGDFRMVFQNIPKDKREIVVKIDKNNTSEIWWIMYICILCCSPQYTAVLAKQEMTIVKHLVFSWSSSGTFFWSLYFIHFDSVPITTKVVSSNPVHGEVYSIQHYVIKFVSDLWLSNGFSKYS
jgi:uncharacterized protein with PQ loop repeat